MIIVSIITNILLLIAGVKYFLNGNEREIKRLSDNTSAYFGAYAFAAMLILLISMWVEKSAGDTRIFSFQNICFVSNVLVWIVLGVIYIWFEALENVPKQFKSRHFALYIVSLAGLIYNSIFTVAPPERANAGYMAFLLFGIGISFIYILGIGLNFLIEILVPESKLKIYKKHLNDDTIQYFLMFGILYPIWQLIQIYIIIKGIIW